MSDTQPRQTPTVRQEPSGATSITTATAVVIVANWGLKLRYGAGAEIPADVAAAMGIILYGAAHLVQLVVLWYLDVREQPKLLPPPEPK